MSLARKKNSLPHKTKYFHSISISTSTFKTFRWTWLFLNEGKSKIIFFCKIKIPPKSRSLLFHKDSHRFTSIMFHISFFPLSDSMKISEYLTFNHRFATILPPIHLQFPCQPTLNHRTQFVEGLTLCLMQNLLPFCQCFNKQ